MSVPGAIPAAGLMAPAPDAELANLIASVNRLPTDAVYIASRDWFGTVMMGKPILAAAQNKRQEAAFEALLGEGFVHGDVERGVYGYRSTYRGQRASSICRAAMEGPPTTGDGDHKSSAKADSGRDQ
jgi:hypothetical protein